MAKFQFTRQMAVEFGHMEEDMARDFGRTFSDLFDLGILGMAAIHFFAPGQHMISTLYAELIDAGLSGQQDIQGHITPAYLDQKQLQGIQQAASTSSLRFAANRNPVAELEPTI